MIGWTTCREGCGCIDEDDCAKAPKNWTTKCPKIGAAQWTCYRDECNCHCRHRARVRKCMTPAICSSEYWGRCKKCLDITSKI